MNQEQKDKALIRKYINQHCTPGELEEMKKLMLIPGIQELFDEVLSESWTGLEAEEDTDQPQLQAKLQQFYKKLEGEEELALQEQEAQQTIVRKIRKRNYLRYAAIWAVGVPGLGIYGITQFKKTPQREQIAMREIRNPNGQVTQGPDFKDQSLGISKMSPESGLGGM